jgi:hypothetical protein
MALENYPEVFFSQPDIKKQLARELKKGALRKIGPRLYTRNFRMRLSI